MTGWFHGMLRGDVWEASGMAVAVLGIQGAESGGLQPSELDGQEPFQGQLSQEKTFVTCSH